MEMIHVNIRHYEGRSTSGPMLIRVSPLYGYDNLSEKFRVNLNVSNFQSALNNCIWLCTHFMVSTPLVLINDISQILSLLGDHKTNVDMWTSPQYNSMLTRGFNYIFDSVHILWCHRHSCSSTICHTYCRYLRTIKPTSPYESRRKITPCLSGV